MKCWVESLYYHEKEWLKCLLVKITILSQFILFYMQSEVRVGKHKSNIFINSRTPDAKWFIDHKSVFSLKINQSCSFSRSAHLFAKQFGKSSMKRWSTTIVIWIANDSSAQAFSRQCFSNFDRKCTLSNCVYFLYSWKAGTFETFRNGF